MVGYGLVAREVVRLIKAFDVRIIVCDNYCSKEEAQKMGFELRTLEYTMSKSDIITIHHTLTENTYHLIDKKAISLIKDGAVIVNTARGKIIEQDALVEELKTGRIAAALDVFEQEPLPADSKLKKMDNVLIFPHMAGKTVECRKRMGKSVLRQVLRFITGESIQGAIDLDTFKKMS